MAELAHYFCFGLTGTGLDLRGFAPEAWNSGSYAWPGNVRELQGVIQQALLHGSGHLVLPEFLPEGVRRRPERRSCRPPGGGCFLPL